MIDLNDYFERYLRENPASYVERARFSEEQIAYVLRLPLIKTGFAYLLAALGRPAKKPRARKDVTPFRPSGCIAAACAPAQYTFELTCCTARPGSAKAPPNSMS